VSFVFIVQAQAMDASNYAGGFTMAEQRVCHPYLQRRRALAMQRFLERFYASAGASPVVSEETAWSVEDEAAFLRRWGVLPEDEAAFPFGVVQFPNVLPLRPKAR
jgi:hypothetical protein